MQRDAPLCRMGSSAEIVRLDGVRRVRATLEAETMYEAFFDLQERPFAPTPRTDHFFPAATIESARQTLLRCIRRAEGVGMVIGPSGTGKSLLCQVLAEQCLEFARPIQLPTGRISSRRSLLQAVLHGLRQPYRGMDEGELRLALLDYLGDSTQCAHGIVLLVDEAHALPLRLLDELRMLTNLAFRGQPRVRLVLAGNSTLEERFASPKLEAFSQRLAARCYLESFNRCETEKYIQHELTRAGGNAGALFAPDACQAVYQATDGVPRLVNQVCDHALILAYAEGERSVSAALVEEAWADLQQLPTPWSREAKASPCEGGVIEGGVVEFGGLSDEGEPAAPPAVQPIAPPVAQPVVQPAAELPVEEGLQEAAIATFDAVQFDACCAGESLDQIDRMIAELNDEFRPAGSIRPEVELIFDDPSSPFFEPFEEEEVVEDRYAEAMQRRLRTRSEAARQAPAALDDDLVMIEEPEMQEAEKPRRAATVPSTVPSTVPLRRAAVQSPPAAECPIIVEEDDEPDAQRPAARVVPIRRHEYRQLFAKLRHG